MSRPKEEVPEISVVIPFLNEEATLGLLRERFERLAGLPAHELVLVSDGSTDGSVAIAERWAGEDPRVRLILLTRNFGHQAAICAGLDFARGRFVAVMDADLQDAPELLPKMYEAATKNGVDVVYGVRSRREGSWTKRLAYRAFYAVYGYAAETPIDRDSGDFCLLSRRSLTMLATLPEKNRFLRGLRSWTGLRSKAFAMDRPERAAGRPQYSWAKLISLALNGITSFSSKPLRLATIAGTLLCAISALMTVFYLAAWYVYDLHSKVPGFTTIIILILFLSGIQFLMMGIIGEYIAQIFQEVKHRPTYLVDRTVNVPGEGDR